jgi:hypothetical protein
MCFELKPVEFIDSVIDFKLEAAKTPLDLVYGLTNEQLDEYAKINKLAIVEPGDNEVQVDIDSPHIPDSFYTQLGILQQFEVARVYGVTTSRSGNKHVTVTFGRKLTPTEQLLYAALLGSDLKREALNAKNIRNGRPRPVFFYEVVKDGE